MRFFAVLLLILPLSANAGFWLYQAQGIPNSIYVGEGDTEQQAREDALLQTNSRTMRLVAEPVAECKDGWFALVMVGNWDAVDTYYGGACEMENEDEAIEAAIQSCLNKSECGSRFAKTGHHFLLWTRYSAENPTREQRTRGKDCNYNPRADNMRLACHPLVFDEPSGNVLMGSQRNFTNMGTFLNRYAQ